MNQLLRASFANIISVGRIMGAFRVYVTESWGLGIHWSSVSGPTIPRCVPDHYIKSANHTIRYTEYSSRRTADLELCNETFLKYAESL